jgi:nucleolar protein 56
MKVMLLSTVYGFIALSESNEIIEKVFHDYPIKQLAETYLKLQKAERVEAFNSFLSSLKNKGVQKIEYEDPALNPLLSGIAGLSVSTVDNPRQIKKSREMLIQILSQIEKSISMELLNTRAKSLSEYMIAQQISEISTMHDFHIKQAVEAINDLDKSINVFATHLREWYGLHFPELTDKIVDDNIKFAEYVAQVGMRSDFTTEILMQKMGLEHEKADLIASKAQRSMGGQLTPFDIKTIQDLSTQVLGLVKYRAEVEEYISKTLEEIAPNLKALLGSAIASKMIAIAGSLERLAEVSSSTIQILGAEKALFKAMKSGGKTPKYGILFQWHKIRTEKPHLRGKIARMLAGKIGILAKVDHYHGQFIGDKLREEVDRKIEILKKQYPNPPKKKEGEPESKPMRREFGKGRDFQKGGRDFQKGGRDFQKGGRDFQKGGRDFSKGKDSQKDRDFKQNKKKFKKNRPGGAPPKG